MDYKIAICDDRQEDREYVRQRPDAGRSSAAIRWR